MIGGDAKINSIVFVAHNFVRRKNAASEMFPYDFMLSENGGYLGLKYLRSNTVNGKMVLDRNKRQWIGNIVHLENEFVFVNSLYCSHAGTGIDQMLDWLVDNGY